MPRREGGGVPALMRLMEDASVKRRPFAPPYLKSGRVLIGQTANILHFLGPRLQLAPASEADRLWVHQLQLTLADLVDETHDTHHPIAASLYYEDQKPEARRRTRHFLAERMPRYLDYFEGVLAANPRGKGHLVGKVLTYADLSAFQVLEGLRYAFPQTMTRTARKWPRLAALREMVAARPNIAAYLASPRRIAFNQHGIFRHYPELER
jgi:glutathione S-transferase